jgi:hypothetical protein
MSKKNIEIGDVFVKRLIISNKSINAELNPLDQLMGVDIWEDMAKPTLYATFMMMDSIGMLETFPIIGEEDIEIEIQTPGLDKTTLFKFKCFEVTNVQKIDSGKGVTFVMKCVSQEHLYNASSSVAEGKTDIISNMVPYLLQDYLRTQKKFISDETKGINTIVFPRILPLQAIDMLRQRAVSKEYPSSSYVFFENQAGFNFKTVEGLYKEGLKNIGSRVFNAEQNTMANKEAQANSYRTLLDYQIINRSDSVKKAQEGVYKAVTKVFDMSKKTFESIEFQLKDSFKDFETSANKKMPNTTDFIDEFASGVSKQFLTIKDTTRPDMYMDQAIAIKNSFAGLLNDDVTRILIHGDTGLKVGDVITLKLPQADGMTKRKKQDSLTSSDYLVIRLRHMLTPSTKVKHQIALDCVKMGI